MVAMRKRKEMNIRDETKKHKLWILLFAVIAIKDAWSHMCVRVCEETKKKSLFSTHIIFSFSLQKYSVCARCGKFIHKLFPCSYRGKKVITLTVVEIFR